MHGRARSEYKAMQRDPKVAAKLAQKAAQWYTLTSQITPDNALPLTEKLLTVNPDPLYLWNQRREQFTSDSKNASDVKTIDWETESRLTATALQNNPKAYGAWFHRKWCLVQLGVSETILQQELLLTVQFLDRDERNFHCWNYRRFVISLLLVQQGQSTNKNTNNDSGAGAWNVLIPDTQDQNLLLMGNQLATSELHIDPDSKKTNNDNDDETSSTTTAKSSDWIQHEWEFTNQKIQQNFSNFSAFHYRSKLYELVQPSLQEELSVVENAIFTEPDDQTAWWYQSFLLRQTTPKDGRQQAWEDHVANLRELLEEVPDSKWVVLGLLNCGMQQNVMPQEEQLALCKKLQEIDADRRGRYVSLEKQILHLG